MEKRKMVKVTIRLHEDTLGLFRRVYPNAGYNRIVRGLTDRHAKAIRENAAEKMGKLSEEELRA